LRSQCLPFTQVPHTTRLFKDFLSWTPEVRKFYSHSPQIKKWLPERISSLKYDSDRRAQVANLLERQNQSWGASAKTTENIKRFRSGAAAIVTGQQVGLFGGPLFAIFKALTAIKLAEEANAAGSNCVPVFWLATTDHDLEEVNQVQLPGPEATLRKISVPVNALTDAPVGRVAFGPEIESGRLAVAELLGESEITELLRQTYREAETFGTAFAKFLVRLFADKGVIVLDAADPEVQQIAMPVYRAAAERARELNQALQARGRELEAAGYHQQVKVIQSSTLLFTLREGARVPVHLGERELFVGEEKISQQQLVSRIESSAEQFSANVLLRPVVQDYLLPTVAYVGGSAEVAYFAQAAVVYEAIAGSVTPIFPRFSATIIEAKQQALLEKYGLGLNDMFQGGELVCEKLAGHTLPEELQAAFEQGEATVRKSLARIQNALRRLDKTLVEASENAASKMQHQLEQLRARAARAELRQQEVLRLHAELLSNTLYPHKILQEREIAGIYFTAKYGTGLLQDLLGVVNPECLDHQVVYLQ